MVTQLLMILLMMTGTHVDEPRRCLRHTECRIVDAKKLQKVHKNWKWVARPEVFQAQTRLET